MGAIRVTEWKSVAIRFEPRYCRRCGFQYLSAVLRARHCASRCILKSGKGTEIVENNEKTGASLWIAPLFRQGQRGQEDPVPPGAPPPPKKSLDNPPEICYNARR